MGNGIDLAFRERADRLMRRRVLDDEVIASPSVVTFDEAHLSANERRPGIERARVTSILLPPRAFDGPHVLRQDVAFGRAFVPLLDASRRGQHCAHRLRSQAQAQARFDVQGHLRQHAMLVRAKTERLLCPGVQDRRDARQRVDDDAQ